jgi:uncharacterized membrane protein
MKDENGVTLDPDRTRRSDPERSYATVFAGKGVKQLIQETAAIALALIAVLVSIATVVLAVNGHAIPGELAQLNGVLAGYLAGVLTRNDPPPSARPPQ